MQSLNKLCAAVALAAASLAQAAPIAYEGSFAVPPGAVLTGTVGGFGWIREAARDVDFWSFAGTGGSNVTIQGTRSNPALDLSLALYSGVTGADDSLFRNSQSWGALTFLAGADDEIESTTGPFGDPLLSFTLPFSGFYTIAIGGSASEGEGPYGYNLSVQVAAIPEPSTTLLLVMGGAALLLRKRVFGPRR